MFVLTNWQPAEAGKQGIGVCCEVGGLLYLVPYEIDEAEDPDAWMAANEQQILADAVARGQEIVPADTAAVLLDEGRKQEADEVIDVTADPAELFTRLSQNIIIKALVLIILDEFNRNRVWHGESELTKQDVLDALTVKIKQLLQ